MKFDLKIKLKTDLANKKCTVSDDKPAESKQFAFKELIILGIVLALLLYICDAFNIIVIGDDSIDNNIEIDTSRTIVVPLTTDETTTIPES